MSGFRFFSLVPVSVFGVALLALASCGMMDKPKQGKDVPKGTVSVKVNAKGGENVPIFLGAYPAGSTKAVSSYRVKNGSVTGFVLDADKTYEFRAFVSRDGKDVPAAGEGVGSVTGVKPDTDVHAQSQLTVVDIPETGPAPAAGAAGPAIKSGPPADLDIDKFDAPKKGAGPEVPTPPKG